MARAFLPAQVGVGSALISASMLLCTFADMGLGAGLIRFSSQDHGRNIGQVNTAFTLAGVVTIAAASLFSAGLDYWAPTLKGVIGDSRHIFFFILISFCTTLSLLADQALLARRQARFILYKNSLVCAAKIPLPVLLFSQDQGFAIFAGTGLAIAAGLLFSFFYWLPRVYPDYKPLPKLAFAQAGEILSFSLGNHLAILMNNAPGLVYPVLTLALFGPEQSAYFYIAWMMAMILNIIPTGIAQSFFAEGSNNPGISGKAAGKCLVLSLVMTSVGIVMLFLFGRILLRCFGAAYAENGTVVAMILSLAIIPQCCNALFMAINQIGKKVVFIVGQSALFCLMSVGAGLWIFNDGGITGIAKAYVLAQYTVALLITVPLLKVIKNAEKEKEEEVIIG